MMFDNRVRHWHSSCGSSQSRFENLTFGDLICCKIQFVKRLQWTSLNRLVLELMKAHGEPRDSGKMLSLKCKLFIICKNLTRLSNVLSIVYMFHVLNLKKFLCFKIILIFIIIIIKLLSNYQIRSQNFFKGEFFIHMWNKYAVGFHLKYNVCKFKAFKEFIQIY